VIARDDGGPAFPGKCSELVSPGGPKTEPQYADVEFPGMSLRDYFAAAAMQGSIASLPEGDEVHHRNTAAFAYRQADAMLAERAKGGGA
jgi:hypothetical protein